MAKGWKQAFDDPIELPRGRQLVTLQDAGNYITKLPQAEHRVPEWQDAMEALILVATARRPDDAGSDRRRTGAAPERRARVLSRSQKDALGQAEAEADR
jgi:hypothetical protein